MFRDLLFGVSGRSARVSMFVFSALLFLSTAFFVFADETTNKNIFQDSDQDGLSNDEEALYGTDPLNKDTDSDGYSDGVEVESGYDPKKPAPGDKLVQSGVEETVRSTEPASSDMNLTTQVSSEIATIIQNGQSDGEAVTTDTINEAVQNVLNQTDQEVVLPEVDPSDIKVKKISKKLKGKEYAAQEREDALEYLTVLAYILANNSPKKFSSESDLGSIVTSLGTDSLAAVTLGNTGALNDLAKKGEKILKETKNIEVPEGMMDVHVKAIKLAKYSTTLKDELEQTSGQQDPLGQIASLSKVQGLLGVMSDFIQEIYGKMQEYDIKQIPVEL